MTVAAWTSEDLVVAYLYTTRKAKQPVTLARLRRTLSGARGLDSVIDQLVDEGSIARRGQSVRLSAAGASRAELLLGPHRGLSSRAFLGQLLPSLAIGEPQALTSEELAAVLLSRRIGRPTTRTARARAAFFWKQLGVDSDAKFTLGAVQKALLGRALGREVKNVDQGFRLVLAEAAGVADRSLGSGLRRSFISRLAPRATRAEPEDFADQVRAAARRSRRTFGNDRAFIVGVYDALSPPYSLEEFKERLLAAAARREVTLHRADLVEAMDPDDVRRSTVVGPGGAEFHFIGVR